MSDTPPWSQRLVSPPGAVALAVPRAPWRRGAVRRQLRDLESGAPVVLSDARSFARGRDRRLLRRARIDIQHEYVALPTLASSRYLVEDAAEPIGYVCDAVLAVPPGVATMARPASMAVWLVQHAMPRRIVGSLARGRVTVGRRR